MQPFVFNTAPSIISKAGASLELAHIFNGLAVNKILLITDPGLVSIGLVQPVIDAMVASGLQVELFDQVREDPPEEIVLAAVKCAQDFAADAVLGFGGGSSMDVAKLAAVLAGSTTQSLSDIYGVDLLSGQRLPLVLVPTTAGTGSEVTPVAVVTTGETTKAGVSSKQLLPDVAVLDAELTLGLPPLITAMTGIDAMVHAIEAYTSKIKKNAYSDALAKEALARLAGSIATAVVDGKNVEARANMLFGAMLAGQAFANAPVAAVHALAYPLGGRYHIPHGLSNSLVLPAVMRFNASHASHLYAELAPILIPNCSGSDEDKAMQLILFIEKLIVEVGLPATLKQAGVSEQSLTTLAEDAMLQQRLLMNNPREVTLADALAIYQAAY
ncbi:MAG: alcohol dehydrogenase class IV [Chitinophagales bacterium]|jgi:alcohol dehydrogenase class IV